MIRPVKFHAIFLSVVFSANAPAQSYFGNKLDNASPASQSVTAVPTPVPETPSPSPTGKAPAASPPEEKSEPLTVADWQRKAVQKFPELKDPRSDLNHKFIRQVNDLKKTNPGYFNNPKWPFLLAESISESAAPISPGLDARPVESPTPTARRKTHPNERRPFDQLDKENVRMEFKVQESNKIRQRSNDGWGYSFTDKTVTKDLEITVIQIGRNKIPVTVEAVFVHGGRGSETFVPGGSQKLESGEGAVTFSSSAQNKTMNYDGYNSYEGQKIIGWLAQAISADGRTLGVAGASEKYLTIAKNPKQLADLIKKSN